MTPNQQNAMKLNAEMHAALAAGDNKKIDEIVNASLKSFGVAVGAKHTRPRNFTTYYYEGANSLEKDYARIGRSCARDNAIRAAVMKLLTKQFMRADIYGEGGTCLGFIKRVGNKITISVF